MCIPLSVCWWVNGFVCVLCGVLALSLSLCVALDQSIFDFSSLVLLSFKMLESWFHTPVGALPIPVKLYARLDMDPDDLLSEKIISIPWGPCLVMHFPESLSSSFQFHTQNTKIDQFPPSRECLAIIDWTATVLLGAQSSVERRELFRPTLGLLQNKSIFYWNTNKHNPIVCKNTQ